MAERLATAGQRVLVIDRRPHFGGNAYDETDDQGVRVHRYGPHIFHTNSQAVFDYLSRFTEWHPYEHRVLTKIGDQLLPFPINLDTINRLYDLDLDEAGIEEFLNTVREPRDSIRTSEDVVVAAVGRDLYEKFFRGYTRKHWGLDPAELSAGVAARIPVRTNQDDRYFTDKFQVMPQHGYTQMFNNILDHKNIEIELGVDFESVRDRVDVKRVIYTGPIDAYFNHRYGRLPYRSLRFEFEHFAQRQQFQPVAQVNYPNDFEYTRITEFKHLTNQQCDGTSIAREYPEAEGDPYYPIPRPQNEILFKKYQALAGREPNVIFVGRLAQYRYYNMDQVVAAALKTASGII